MTPTTFNTYVPFDNTIVQRESEPNEYRSSPNWACSSCGTTYDATPPKRINAGRGIRIIPGYVYPRTLKSSNLKVAVLETKAGPLTIVTRHVEPK